MIIQILVLLALLAFLLRVFGVIGGRRRSAARRFKCHDCRHLRRTFDDGVLCGYGGKEVFKNPVHVSNCMDWESVKPVHKS